MSTNIHMSLSSQVKKLLGAVGVKVRTYEDLSTKVNFTFDALIHYDEIVESMRSKKALHINEMNVVAVDENALTSTEDANELVLHELIHMTASKLERVYEGETGQETEECVAQIGMFKLILVLGLNPAPYADKTLEYIKQFPKANFKKAEIDSDKAVEYLVKFVGLEKVA
jgi:hypothetical protein